MRRGESISEAIDYIEKNITKNISIEVIAKHACFSPFYFQSGFAMLCGFTVLGVIKNFKCEEVRTELPKFWENIMKPVKMN